MFCKLTKNQAKQAAADALMIAHGYHQAWCALENVAVTVYGYAPLTSGIGYAADAPESVKNALRQLTACRQNAQALSLSHWKRGGMRDGTWRAFKDAFNPATYTRAV